MTTTKKPNTTITAKQIANAAAFSNIEIAGGFMSADAMRLFPSEKP